MGNVRKPRNASEPPSRRKPATDKTHPFPKSIGRKDARLASGTLRKRYLRRPDASDERGANKIKLQRQLVIYADWAKADPKTSKNELKLNRILFMRKALEYIYEFNEFPVDPKTGKTLVKRGPDGKLLFPWQKGFGE